MVKVQLQYGESVLIYATTGGIGQAAVSIALHMGCTVFTIVNCQSERDTLMETFRPLKESHIFILGTSSFDQLILTQTGGRGVDVVLSSIDSKHLQPLVRCLSEGGRFVKVGETNFSNGTKLSFSNASFHAVPFNAILNVSPAAKKQIVQLILDGINSGAVKPLPRQVCEENEVEQAFRCKTFGKRDTKVLLKIYDENDSVSKTVLAIRQTYMNPNKTYVLIGGLGGFGLKLADWLISRGAQKLVLTSRSGITTGYQALKIRQMRNRHIQVIISTLDATTKTEAEALLKESNNIGVVGGIFNLAAVIRDATMENQTEDHFKTVMKAKINTLQSLDVASRKLTSHLDYFVAFSSVASGRGNAGQSNYGFANSAMERICEIRRSQGLPALAIQWGAIGDVGMLYEQTGGNTAVVVGTRAQRISSCLDSMDILLRQVNPVVSCYVPKEKNSEVDSVQNNIVSNVASILHISDVDSVSRTTTFTRLGMDSLMATEVRKTLERGFNIFLNPKEIRGLTFAKLEHLNPIRTAVVKSA